MVSSDFVGAWSGCGPQALGHDMAAPSRPKTLGFDIPFQTQDIWVWNGAPHLSCLGVAKM